jgi:hypothetical protein
MGKTNYFLSCLPFSFSHRAAYKSYLENSGKMSLIPVFKINSPQAQKKLEFDVLGVKESLRNM